MSFVKNETGDYTGKIMEFINYLISFSGEEYTYLGKKTTYAKAFNEIMEKIFEWVEFPEETITENDIYKILTEAKKEASDEEEDEV